MFNFKKYFCYIWVFICCIPYAIKGSAETKGLARMYLAFAACVLFIVAAIGAITIVACHFIIKGSIW